jgi:SAM-dependent methyltransferase
MANERMREMWTKHGGPAWSANRHVFESVMTPIFNSVLEALGPVAGLTVLDVGCGTGGLSAAVVERGGSAVGVDISETMIATARDLHPEARFEVVDAQDGELSALEPDGFDKVTSEFGVMFFEDPVAAFANIGRATKSGGSMAFACWRSEAENKMFTLGSSLLVSRMPEPPPPAPPGSPGPTAFADRGHVAGVLDQAGWTDVAIEPRDPMLCYSIDGSDGVEERIAIIRAGQSGRLAEEQLRPRLGEDGWADLLDEVRAELRRNLVDGVVQFPGAIWLVTASRP